MRHDPGGAVSPEVKRFRSRLIYALVLGTLLVLGSNCGVQAPRLSDGSAFTGGFRWAAGDTSRMLRNAQYFKLMGQPELGIKELEEAHRLDPGNLKVADALAQYYDELGMGARAQQIYLEALALAPDSPALQNNLCFSYYQAGNWSQAEAERVATILNKKFFPGAEFEPAPRLADNIDVKVVLGHDLGSLQPAEAPRAHGPRL